MRALLVVLLLVLPALAGCFDPAPGGTTPIDTGDGGDDGGDGNGDSALPGRHLALSVKEAALAEGAAATLVARNAGDTALAGSALLQLYDPAGVLVAQSTVAVPGGLDPAATFEIRWTLPAPLESGTYRWNVTLDGATASVAKAVSGTALPGEGAPPLGTVRTFNLAANLTKVTYYRTDDVLLTLRNTGNSVVRGVNVTVRGPADVAATDPAAAPVLFRRSLPDLAIDAGASATLAPLVVPPEAVPAGAPQYFVVVEWRQGTFTANFFIENRTLKPDATPGPLARTWEAAPTYDWNGLTSVAVVNASGGSETIWIHFADLNDVSEGHASSDIVPTQAYLDTVKAALVDSWSYYKAQGWLLADRPIHVYINHPGGIALGTTQATAYGAEVVIGPKSLHDAKDADVRATVAHELFHVLQLRYDLDEGILIEGFATWIMDQPFGTREYLGHARGFLNEPDAVPGEFLEYKLVLFLHWLNRTHGPASLKELTERSADYDSKEIFLATYGKTFEALWFEFAASLAARQVTPAADTLELFEKEGVFGLKAWEWLYTGAATTVASEKENRTLKLPIANFELHMIDEDVGRVKHAYGFDVFELKLDNTLDPAADWDVTLTVTSGDADTDLRAFLARGSGTSWTVTPITLGAATSVVDLQTGSAFVFLTRGAAGTGLYDVSVTPA